MNNDKSRVPAIQWIKELGFKVIEEYNDGKTYLNRKGNIRGKKNLGCDFWIEEEGELITVEAKMSFEGFSQLRIHQLNRINEGGILIIVKRGKDNNLSFDIKTCDDIEAVTQTMREIYWKKEHNLTMDKSE